MPYVVKNILTGEYVPTRYTAKDKKDVNTAKTFTKPGYAFSSNDFIDGLHEMVRVELVESKDEPTVRGRWMTAQEYRDKYNGDEWRPGDNLCSSPYWEHIMLPYTPNNSTDRIFQEHKGKVYQLIWLRQVTKDSDDNWHTPIMCEVYPTKPLHYHAFERKYV